MDKSTLYDRASEWLNHQKYQEGELFRGVPIERFNRGELLKLVQFLANRDRTFHESLIKRNR